MMIAPHGCGRNPRIAPCALAVLLAGLFVPAESARAGGQKALRKVAPPASQSAANRRAYQELSARVNKGSSSAVRKTAYRASRRTPPPAGPGGSAAPDRRASAGAASTAEAAGAALQSYSALASDPLLRAVALQSALDRAGYSPGVIDGAIGAKTQRALRAFQQSRGLPAGGEPGRETIAALGLDSAPPTVRYSVSERDLAQVGSVPKDWNAKAALDELNYESLAALLAERGHCTQALLARLNPRRDLNRLRPGDSVTLPNVAPDGRAPDAALVEVHLSDKVVTARDDGGRVLALFHCSVARETRKLPRGSTRVEKVARDPTYTFDPKMWPEVKTVRRKLTIPPGPRNPVGVCWIGMGLPGYGIHGTPAPEMIGKTGSHGCIRLTNWDVLRLSDMVSVGTPVRFVGS